MVSSATSGGTRVPTQTPLASKSATGGKSAEAAQCTPIPPLAAASAHAQILTPRVQGTNVPGAQGEQQPVVVVQKDSMTAQKYASVVVELVKYEVEKEVDQWQFAMVLYVVGDAPSIGAIERFNASLRKFVTKPKIVHCFQEPKFSKVTRKHVVQKQWHYKANVPTGKQALQVLSQAQTSNAAQPSPAQRNVAQPTNMQTGVNETRPRTMQTEPVQQT
ncbi:hypothetical protein K7X08_033893 [Anisodus acutangulus]|uniref:Uncharacterized protein n=1 Tax=Anisodus acutangulus TaxID=402998 RepID=A0A9Q1RCK8_9SOLA|nr:hypothetical protein K7X08_033893 [Anisodus acutangulus]